MKIIKGRFKDREVRLVQGANDWLMVDVVDGPSSQIVRPTMVELAPDEHKLIGTHISDTVLREFSFDPETGRFTHRPEARR